MSPCNLRLSFEHPDRRYRPGETISGRIDVSAAADADCPCEALTVGLFWTTRGEGQGDHGQGCSCDLFRGTWRRGERKAYGFELLAPSDPLTYHGKNIHVAWYVEAEARSGRGKGPKVVEEIVIEPRPGCLDPGSALEGEERKQRWDASVVGCFLGLFAGFGLVVNIFACVLQACWVAYALQQGRRLRPGCAWSFSSAWQRGSA